MQGPNTYFLGAVIGEEKRYDSSPCPASWTSAKRLESKPPFGGGRREQGRKLGGTSLWWEGNVCTIRCLVILNAVL